MPVITLSRQLGSGGDEIAAAVAERLGLRLVGFELINRAAREAGAPEVALAAIDELGLLGIRPGRAAIRAYREKIFAVVGELAAEGKLLLVGRGGQVILAGRPGVLHVRVIAPREQRVARLAETRADQRRSRRRADRSLRPRPRGFRAPLLRRELGRPCPV